MRHRNHHPAPELGPGVTVTIDATDDHPDHGLTFTGVVAVVIVTADGWVHERHHPSIEPLPLADGLRAIALDIEADA